MHKLSDFSCKIYTLSHLAVITVTGEDSAKFLQGQLTCDIRSLSESKAGIAAFCNPKGRVITTLLAVKTAGAFLLILPAGLLDKVFKKLQLYILRSSVWLSGQDGSLQIFGLNCRSSTVTELEPPAGIFGGGDDFVVGLPFSPSHYLCIANQPQSAAKPILKNRFESGEAEEWRYDEISSGFPWFEASQSELYTPQMLNIDQLGGVSFNKGCYTGQEIIARTHYLGQAKRSLFLAECGDVPETPVSGMAIIDLDTQQNAGNILNAAICSQNTRLLAVLHVADVESKNLVLDDAKRTAIKIAPIQ